MPNPVNSWQAKCRRRGGVPTVYPRGFPNAGAPSCRFIVNGRPDYRPAGESIRENIERRQEEGADAEALRNRAIVERAGSVAKGVGGFVTGTLNRVIILAVIAAGVFLFLEARK